MVFDIDVQLSKDTKIKNFYNKALKDLDEFYQTNGEDNKFRIFLIKSRKEFDALYEKKTEKWVVGSTMGSIRDVYLLSPDVYEKESTHKYSDKKYEILLRHELSHQYCRIFYSDNKPRWFLEGIAIYSSGELEINRKITEFTSFLDFFDKGGGNVYDESGWAVFILDKEFGREKLLELLKSLEGIQYRKDFEKIFKEIYGIELKYEWFNQRVELTYSLGIPN